MGAIVEIIARLSGALIKFVTLESRAKKESVTRESVEREANEIDRAVARTKSRGEELLTRKK